MIVQRLSLRDKNITLGASRINRLAFDENESRRVKNVRPKMSDTSHWNSKNPG